MKVFPDICNHCKERLQTGDEIISFGEYREYHASCHKEIREKALQSVGNMERALLDNIGHTLTHAQTLLPNVDSNNQEDFQLVKSSLLKLHIDLGMVFSLADMNGGIGLLEKNRIKRDLNKVKSTIFDVMRKCSGEFIELRSQLANMTRQVYPTPNFEELEQKLSDYFESLKRDCENALNTCVELNRTLIQCTDKALTKERSRIRKEIEDIPRHTIIYEMKESLLK